MNWMRCFLLMPLVVVLGGASEVQAENSPAQPPEGVYTLSGPGGEQITYEIDARQTGFLRGVKVGQKKLVDANNEPPLVASVLESAGYDGFSDFVGGDGGKVIDAVYKLDHCTAQKKGEQIDLTTTGQLAFPGGDAIAFEVQSTLKSSGHVRVTVQAKRVGAFKDRYLRQFALRLPLALNPRKRIVQGGDRGMRFDERSMYQFHCEGGSEFLEFPDFNFWQHFWIDQSSPVDYHLWRSESLAASGLTEFRGRKAPGWMTAYDQQGGVLLSYKDMAARAPKAIYIGTRGSGVGEVYFQAPTHTALDFYDPAATRVFDCVHQTDWIFFSGAELDAKPDQTLEKIWNTKLASDAPQRGDDNLDKIELLDAKLTGGADAPLVVGGVPFPQGQVTALTQIALSYNNQAVPLQTRAEAYWPDGSLKWVLLTFPLEADKDFSVAAANGTGKTLPLTITLRHDKANSDDKRTFTLHYGKDVTGGQTTSPLMAKADGDVITINTGPLELKLTTGARWLAAAKLGGRSLLRADKKATGFADFVHTAANDYPPNTTHPRGAADDGALVIDKIELQESGPLRAIVRLEGKTNSQVPQIVTLHLEAYAGRSYVRVFHSVDFQIADPRVEYLRRMGISLPLEMDAKQAKTPAGLEQAAMVIGDLASSARLGLRQDSILHFSAWQQNSGLAGVDHFRSVVAEGNRSRGWLDVADGRGGVAVILRNMWQEAPSELVASAQTQGTDLSIDLWPESAPVMDIRRYSNYLHLGQGESPPGPVTWVDDFWYGQGGNKGYNPRDCVKGISKTHEMLIYFHDAAATPAAIDSLAADFQRPALIYCGAKWYIDDAKILAPTVVGGDPKYQWADRNMQNTAQFVLFHQNYWNWYGKWDFGDVRHMFKRGYGQVVSGQKLAELLKMTPAERKKLKTKELGSLPDYWPAQDWAYDNGRWGWGNTESLPNQFMQREYLRTGNREIYFFCEACARESRDVVMRHEGRWFGEGTRHGVQHWSDGDHEPRQDILSEVRYACYLGGDLRTAEFVKKLTSDYFLKASIDATDTAGQSARLYGLLMAWEMTGNAAIGQTLQTYVHSMCVPDGLDTSPSVEFPSGKAVGHPRNPNVSDMWFSYFGGMPAVLEYYELTHDPVLRDALIKYADRSHGDMVDGGDYDHKFGSIQAHAFAARYAEHPEKYRQDLNQRLEDMYRTAYQTLPDDRAHWTGLDAPVTQFPGAMFWLNTEGYVMTALDKEPAPTADHIKTMRQRAVYNGPLEKGWPEYQKIQIPVKRESWQDDLDDPALKDYTTPKRPLEP